MALLSIVLSLGSGVSLALSDSGFHWASWAASSAFCIFVTMIAGSALRPAVARSRECGSDPWLDHPVLGRGTLDGSLVTAGHALIDSDEAIERTLAHAGQDVVSLAHGGDDLASLMTELTGSVRESAASFVNLAKNASDLTRAIVEARSHMVSAKKTSVLIPQIFADIHFLVRDSAAEGADFFASVADYENRHEESSLPAKLRELETAVSPLIDVADSFQSVLRQFAASLETTNQEHMAIAAKVDLQQVLIEQITRSVQFILGRLQDLAEKTARVTTIQAARHHSAKFVESEVRRNPSNTAAIARLLAGIGQASSKERTSKDALPKFLGPS